MSIIKQAIDKFLSETYTLTEISKKYKIDYDILVSEIRSRGYIFKKGYSNCTIYLDRKYEKYLEYCRLYEKSCRELENKNGEGCDANPVLNSEIAKGSESV